MKSREVFWAIAIFLLLMLLGVDSSQAQDKGPFITVGQKRVHATRILARYRAGIPAIQQQAVLTQQGLTIRKQFATVPGLVVLDVKKGPVLAGVNGAEERPPLVVLTERMAALKATGLFEYVEPDYEVRALATPTDSAFVDGTLWGLRNTGQNGGAAGGDIGAVAAWDITTGSTNVIVAVVDTGIRYTHNDLAAQMWRNPGEIPANGIDDDGDGFVDNIFGINSIVSSGDPMDDNDHGTHVAGTIGAAANNGNPHVGVAWNVRLMACKFLDNNGSGAISDAIECVNFAVQKGAKILNNSWGGGGYSQGLFDAIAAARNQGVLFVAAAGNSGANNDFAASYPSTYDLDNIVAVAAVDRFDALANFSNFGSNTVHLAAPGVSIYSTTQGSNSAYQTFNGTSMATPHVVGVAALIRAHYPDISLVELRQRLLMGALPISSLQGKTITGGRLNAYYSLTVTPDGILEITLRSQTGQALSAGTVTPLFVHVNDL
ncbi:MAG: S8 family serine peptidase, partial [Opitutaceae bacterium]|nr:S8 family serine peptidase [Verrucomicrobiales bacterium]